MILSSLDTNPVKLLQLCGSHTSPLVATRSWYAWPGRIEPSLEHSYAARFIRILNSRLLI